MILYTIGALVLAGLYFFLVRRFASPYKAKFRVCRSCGKEVEHMAITYGETEGLCRPCFDDVLPLALRKDGGEELLKDAHLPPLPPEQLKEEEGRNEARG